VLLDKFLSSRTSHDCILRHDTFATTEIDSDANGYETGAYLYLSVPNNDMIQQWRRAGSAAVSEKKREDEHVRASMQRSDQDRDSLFYRTFPYHSKDIFRIFYRTPNVSSMQELTS
jgi:hypothetical protein